MRKIRMVVVLVWTVLVATPGLASIQNGDFTSGLLGWKSSWHVTSANSEAVLSDSQENHAFVFQSVQQTGVFTLGFDLFNGLSDDVPEGTFRDSFYASLYFVDSPAQFILEHDQFGGSAGVMDSDAAGTFNVKGSISDSTKGGDWWHFSGTFTNTHVYAVVVFELYDLNFIRADSSVRVDNVTVTVPEVPDL